MVKTEDRFAHRSFSEGGKTEDYTIAQPYMKHKLVITTDGSHTIYVPELDEHYHSVHGALQESEHIFIKAGYEYSEADPVRIFEAGFGTGLNVFLTALKSIESKRKVVFTTIELYPLEENIVKQLNYSSRQGPGGKELFDKIHNARWDKPVKILENFTLDKIKADLITFDIQGIYDIIYFDAFGPDKQPEMWTNDIIDKISAHTCKGGIFITYSVKGELKRNLRSAGFRIELLPGPPGKRQILRGIKI